MWTETDCMVESIECVFCCGLLTQNSPYTHFQLAELSIFGEFDAFESYAMNHISNMIFVLVAYLFTPNILLSTPNYHRKLMTLLSFICFVVFSFYCDFSIFFSLLSRHSLYFVGISVNSVNRRISENSVK